jgi:hypothetical protein
VSRIEKNGKRSLRWPKLSNRKFNAWKKKKEKKYSAVDLPACAAD